MHLLACCRTSARARRAVITGLCTVLLPLACARPAPPPVAARAERVVLGFGWPAGFTARVSGVETSRFVVDAARDESRTQMSYRLRLEPAQDGTRVRYDDFALPDPRTDGLVRLGAVAGLERLGLALQPSFLVSTDGRFAGAPDLDTVATAVNRELDALRAQPSGLPGDAPPLPARFSAELFRRHAPADWMPMVELWAGREIELGARYTVELVTRLSLLEGVPIRMKGELRVSERIACDAADADARCVELVLASRPDPAMLPWLQSAGAGAAAVVTVSALELDETVRVVTEPETLVPYRVSTDRRARVELRLPDGSHRSTALDEEKDVVFRPGAS